jgi:hypothetical protein
MAEMTGIEVPRAMTPAQRNHPKHKEAIAREQLLGERPRRNITPAPDKDADRSNDQCRQVADHQALQPLLNK